MAFKSEDAGDVREERRTGIVIIAALSNFGYLFGENSVTFRNREEYEIGRDIFYVNSWEARPTNLSETPFLDVSSSNGFFGFIRGKTYQPYLRKLVAFLEAYSRVSHLPTKEDDIESWCTRHKINTCVINLVASTKLGVASRTERASEVLDSLCFRDLSRLVYEDEEDGDEDDSQS